MVEEIEKKDRRVFLLWQRSLYDEIKTEADQCGESVNDYVHSILRDVMNNLTIKLKIREMKTARRKYG
jgi:hypothetical protein